MTSSSDGPAIENSIAIVGMACRVAGASTVADFWDNIQNGKESLTHLSDDELLAAGVPESLLSNPDYVKAGMFMDDIRGFDAEFFGFSPRDARILDPQHRHFLEICWEALEDGGVNPYDFEGAIGVFGGSGHNSYMPYNLLSNPDLVDEVGFFLVRHTGNDKDFLTTRVSYNFNLRGPSLNIQTACSTSLVSVHAAVQSLLNFECDSALAGGISILLPDRQGYLYEEGGILSEDGHCRPFDAGSNGTIISSGGGVVLLKRLEDAIQDRDRIHGVILGSAINNDGSGKVNYLSPSVDGQAAAIAEALEISGVDPDSVEFIECHGTGTNIGDPIEIAALTQAYGRDNSRLGYCAVGSAKSNIGHTDTAAGVLGLIKAVMSLKSAKIAPTVHFNAPNPSIDFENTPFYVNENLSDWESEGPRRAAVSSLGVGGTNAHVILEEAPVREPSEASPWNILALSAKTPTALGATAERLKSHLENSPEENLSDCEFTLLRGREVMEYRRAVVVGNSDDALAALGDLASDRWVKGQGDGSSSEVVFMYAGGGAQYPGMGRDLYKEQPVFRKAIDECADILKKYVDYDLLSLLFPEPENLEEASVEMEKPSRSLPCLFSMQYAQSMLWLSLGVEPKALIGHSMGENTALCIAGGISLEEGLSLVAKRGYLQEQAPEGGMLSVLASPEMIEDYLVEGLTVGVINGPEMCVVSGPSEQLGELQERLDKDEVQNVRVRINVAAHSPMLDPILPEFKAHLETFDFKTPTIPIASTFSGTWLTEDQAVSAEYWTDQLRNPVKYSDAASLLLTSEKHRAFLEVGPANILTSLTRQQPDARGRTVIASSRHRKEEADDNAFMLTALGALWAADADVQWDRYFGERTVGRTGLPTYPFEHQEHWINAGASRPVSPGKLGERNASDKWYYQPTWKPVKSLAPLSLAADGAGVAVIADPGPIASGIASRLQAAGYQAELVAPSLKGEAFRLKLEELASTHSRGLGVILLAGLMPPAPDRSGLDETFFALWHLARTLLDIELPPTRLSVVSSRSIQCITGEPLPGAVSATMHGMIRVLPKEMPELSVRYIDTDLNELPAGPALDVTLDMVVGEALDGFDGEVEQTQQALAADYSRCSIHCYRGGQRLEETFTQIAPYSFGLPDPERILGSHILISGGMGGLGLEAAKHFAGNGCSHLSLISRSGLPHRDEWHRHRSPDSRLSRQIIAIEKLEALGVDVNVIVADVTDAKAVGEAVARARETGGRICGLIHAAGTLDDRLLQLKTESDAKAVLEPKVIGALNLVEAVQEDELEFAVFYSSISAYLGAQGQSDYAAANAFLDSFSRDLRARGVPAIAINWSVWKDIGMAADLAEGRRPAGSGFAPFSPRMRGDVYETCIGTSDWIVNEHRTREGLAVVPGTGLIQLVYSAAQANSEDFEDVPLKIEDMSLFAPVSVPDGGQLVAGVKFVNRPEGYDFEILSATNPWEASSDSWEGEHVHGRITKCEAGQRDRFDIDSVKGRMVADKEFARTGLVSLFMNFGDRWGCLNGYWSSDGEILAEMKLPSQFAADLDEYTLHPALLDNAVAGLQSLHHNRENPDEFLIPMAFGSITVFDRLPAHIFSHLRFIDSGAEDRREFDVDIYDESGKLLVSVRRFSMKVGNSDSLDSQVSAPDVGGSYIDFSGGISPEEGNMVLDSLVGNPFYSQVLVSPVDLHAVLADAQLSKDRLAVESVSTADSGSFGDFVAPDTPVQQKLSEIWQKGLGLEQIGINDNFFSLGGHSLLLTQLAGRVKKEFEVNLKISQLFDNPTISSWSGLIDDRDVEETEISPPTQLITRHDRNDCSAEFPASATQSTFWFIYQMDPDCTAYSIPLGFRILGDVDPERFRSSIEAVVSRHEILRTRYRENDDGSLVQVLESVADVPFEYVEVAGENPTEKQEALDQLLEAEFHRPVRIDSEPVLRCNLFKLDEREFVFVLVIHHIAVDHLAIGILLEEMAENYRHLSDGNELSDVSDSLQYLDYLEWHREEVSGSASQSAKSVWKKRLDPFSGVLELPTTFPRPAVQSFDGRDHYFQFSPEVSRLIKEYSKSQNTSLFSVVLACLQVLYQRYTRQNDIIVGTPFSDRNQDEQLEGVIGCFINTLPLATLFSDDLTFADLLSNVRQVMMEAFENQAVPLEDIVHDLGLQRDVSRSPLFQVGFVFQEPPMSFSLPGAEISTMELRNFGAMYDLHTFMWDAGETIGGVITYNTSLFDKEFVLRFLATLESAAEGLISNPGLEVLEVPMLSSLDEKLLGSVNATESEFLRSDSVIHLFQSQLGDGNKNVAVSGADGEMTYEELDSCSDAIAAFLVAKGVKPGDLVGIGVDRGARMLAALLGIWKAGAAYVPLDPEFPSDRLAYMMETAAIGLLITQKSLESRIPAFDCPRVLLDTDWEECMAIQVGDLPSPVGGEQLAYVIFTSGSTGRPKGVQIPHRAAVNFLRSMAKTPGIASADTLLAVTTLSFDISVLELFLPLCVGAQTVVATSEQSGDGRELLRLIDEKCVSIMQATPSTWRLMLAEGWLQDGGDWSGFTVLCGGEAFPLDLAKTLAAGVGTVWNMYGPTETTVWSTCKRIDPENVNTRIGQPIDNTGVHVLNEAGQPVPPGVPGVLHISGDGLSMGYLGRDDLTEQSFFDHPSEPGLRLYNTGDLVILQPDGELEYLQRLDGQIKLRGYRIELGEIESVLAEHESVASVVANVWSSGDGDERLVAYVIPESGDVSIIQLRKAARSRLPDYMIPQHFVELTEIPMTANGKIDRKSLPSPLGLNKEAEKEPPQSDTEKGVAAIWSEVLGEENIYREDYFFDIGGHSLLAVEVISKLEKICGVRLNPRMIVMQSLSEISASIDSSS